jgi:hypothetical protein
MAIQVDQNDPVVMNLALNNATGEKDGHPIAILPEASIIPSGVVSLMQLQE